MGRPRIPIDARLRDSTDVDPEAGCWNWNRFRDKDGYGKIAVYESGTGVKRAHMAHRESYEHFVGPIPPGMQLDHLCCNRACCNPEHLEPVTARENALRGVGYGAENLAKTHCKHGHEFTPENTYVHYGRTHPRRSCVECGRATNRRTKARRRARMAA